MQILDCISFHQKRGSVICTFFTLIHTCSTSLFIYLRKIINRPAFFMTQRVMPVYGVF